MSLSKVKKCHDKLNKNNKIIINIIIFYIKNFLN